MFSTAVRFSSGKLLISLQLEQWLRPPKFLPVAALDADAKTYAALAAKKEVSEDRQIIVCSGVKAPRLRLVHGKTGEVG